MPEGWRAAFVGVKGDAKARAAMNMFARHYGATYICDGCFATQGFPNAPRSLLFADFSGQALWHQTVDNHECYVSYTPDAKQSAWRHVPGWRMELSYRDSTGVSIIKRIGDSSPPPCHSPFPKNALPSMIIVALPGWIFVEIDA